MSGRVTCSLRRPLAAVGTLALGVAGALVPHASLVPPAAAVVGTSTATADSAPRRIVSGWIRPAPYQAAALASLRANADLWSEVSPFWFSVSGPTTLNGRPDAAVVAELRRLRVPVVPTVVETLTTPRMEALLASPGKRHALADTVAALVRSNGYAGVDLDFEAMNSGGTAAQKRHVAGLFVTFLTELRARLGQGALLTAAVGPRTSSSDPNWLVHDYRRIGGVVDRLRLMTYDAHYRGGQPGPIAPLPWVKTVLGYAVSVVPRAKIQLGVPLYGYDWPQKPDGTYGTATSLGTYALAEALRTRTKAARQYSAVDAAPFFTYVDANGVRHQVWYNDAASTAAKVPLVGTYGIRGVAFWHASGEDARQWPAIRRYAVQRATSVTATAPASVRYGVRVPITGLVRAATAGTPLAGLRVRLQDRSTGARAWATRATATSGADGRVRFVTMPRTSREFRLVTAATWAFRGSTSRTLTTLVRWRVTATVDDPTVRPGDRITFRGTVAPARAHTVVQRQRLVGDTWTTVASGRTSGTGAYALTFAARTAGTFTYRMRVPGTRTNAAATSRALTVTVS